MPPWFTSAYRIVTGSDWIFRSVLRGAWGAHPPRFDDALLDEFQRPFKVPGTAAAFTSMLRYGIQGVPAATLRSVRTPRLVLWGHTRFVAIPGAGHLSMLAAPAAVARDADEFAARAGS